MIRGCVTIIFLIPTFAVASTFSAFPASELPVSAPDSVTADHSQINPVVAAGPDVYLAVWQNYLGGRMDLYAARIDGKGELLDRDPILIAATTYGILGARVAWAQDRFLIVWQSNGTLRVTAISPAGEILDERLIGTGYLQSMACGQSGCVVVSERWGLDGRFLEATRLDARGFVVTSSRQIAKVIGTLTSTVAAASDDGFLIAWQRWLSDSGAPNRSAIYVAAVSANGTPGPPRLIAGNTAGLGPYGIASDSRRFLISWVDPMGTAVARATLLSVLLNPDASLAGRPVSLPLNVAISGRADLTFTGDSYLLVMRSSWEPPRIDSLRLGTDGVALDPAPALVAEGPESGFDVAAGNGPPLIVWSRGSTFDADLYGALLSDSKASSTNPIVVARSASGQRAPALASDGENLLVAWLESAAEKRRIRMTMLTAVGGVGEPQSVSDLTSTALQGPAVAFGADEFLLVWEERTASLESAVKARRIARSGAFIGEPLTLSTLSCGGGVTVAWSGAEFLIAWSDCTTIVNQVRVARIANGVAIDSRGVSAGSPLPNVIGDIVSNGVMHLVTWVESRRASYSCDGACIETLARAVRIGSDGSVLDADGLRLSDTNSFVAPTPLRALWDGSQFLVIWGGSHSINVTAVGMDGPPKPQQRLVSTSADRLKISAQLIEGEVVIAWDTERDVMMARIRASTPVPVTGGVFAASEEIEGAPSVLSPDGHTIVLAYTRTVHEPSYGGATRVFVRRVIGTDRKRAVKR